VPYLKETTVEGHSATRLYHRPLLHKEFAQPWPVVLFAKTNLRTQTRAHVILCSSAVALAYAPRVDYYRLRCQSECHFRDAKQSGGLEDSMNVTPTGVTNAAHRAWCMGNGAYRRRADIPARDSDARVLDLQADCRGYTYVQETRQMLPEQPAPVLCAKMLHQVAGVGRIHVSPPAFSFS
jgi:hypothetical protein